MRTRSTAVTARSVVAASCVATALAISACGSGAGGTPTGGSDGGVSGGSRSSTSVVPSSAAVTATPVSVGCAPTVRSMSLNDKLARLLMVGVSGPADAEAVVRDHHVGGIFLGSTVDGSIYSGGRLRAIRALSPHPLMVSVDQEGGRVSRLADLGVDSPSARELARTRTPAQVRLVARRSGTAMARLGITVDLAPDADVSDEPADDVIGDRSFSDDPAVVARYAAAFADGLRDAGIMPVFKHFPGHGHGSGDSHTGTVDTPPIARLRTDDLVPYRTLLPGPVTPRVPSAGVMVGHLVVPGLTDDQTPASLSPAVMRMLRTGIGYGGRRFDGPIVTDDLSGMAAITARYGITDAVVRAVVAGADTALWLSTDDVPSVIGALTRAVRGGRLPLDQVDASVARTLHASAAC